MCVCVCVYLLSCTQPHNPALSSQSFYATRIDPPKGGSMILVTKTSDQACVRVFFLPIHSGHHVRWTYQPGSDVRKVAVFFYPPSFCGACLSLSRENDSVIPFPRRL